MPILYLQYHAKLFMLMVDERWKWMDGVVFVLIFDCHHECLGSMKCPYINKRRINNITRLSLQEISNVVHLRTWIWISWMWRLF